MYQFSVNGTLAEASSIGNSSSPYWWVNSGAYLYLKDGVGQTVQGNLPAINLWRTVYAAANPRDTDVGYHPQNIFRLVTRSQWKNFRQEVEARIVRDQLSSSEYRNSSNGVLLFNRYQDGQNLYYTGVRVDGTAVIKKKKNGAYYTMGQTRIIQGTYNRDSNPNLLPKNSWFAIRSEITDEVAGTRIKLFVDMNKIGAWKEVLNVLDNGSTYGGSAIAGPGYAGIRTDFMDAQFDNYRMKNL